MRLVYAEQFNVDLPSFIGEYEDVHDKVSIAEIYEGYHRYWRAISASEARLGDAVVMRLKGLPIHFGIMLAPGRFLHVLEGLNSVIEKTKAPLWKDRIVGYWRHEGMQ
jgi:cell wall-associated NlpC family hydrolase